MTNEELKLITASNIINLRTSKKLTQAELGQILNYSDKTISKWERAEAIPDAFVLTQIANYFGVDVNYLLSSHVDWELFVTEEEQKDAMYDANAVIAVTLLGVLTAAVLAFAICWLCGLFEWKILLIGTMCMSVVFLILDCVFKKGANLKISLTLLIVNAFVLVYFLFEKHTPWQIFLAMIPAIVLAIVATEINRHDSPIRRMKR